MKYHNIIAMLPRLLDAEAAADYVGGPKMLADLGVKPIVQKKGMTRYDRTELDRAIDKLKLAAAAEALNEK